MPMVKPLGLIEMAHIPRGSGQEVRRKPAVCGKVDNKEGAGMAGGHRPREMRMERSQKPLVTSAEPCDHTEGEFRSLD